jgi:hypothetical protein
VANAGIGDNMKPAFIFILASSLSLAAQAGSVYKTVDANGKTVYSDSPPGLALRSSASTTTLISIPPPVYAEGFSIEWVSGRPAPCTGAGAAGREPGATTNKPAMAPHTDETDCAAGRKRRHRYPDE